MAEKKRHITVFTDWESSGIPQLMGELSATQIRGKEIFAFEYDKQWLKVNEYLFSLDPDLALYSGKQYLMILKVILEFLWILLPTDGDGYSCVGVKPL